MHTIEVTRKFATEDACLDYLEAMRWCRFAKHGLPWLRACRQRKLPLVHRTKTTRTRYSNSKDGQRSERFPFHRGGSMSASCQVAR